MPDLVAARRVTFLLPVNTVGERWAAEQVVHRVRLAFGGATHSLLQPSMLRGYWENEAGELFIDEIALVFADTEISEPDLTAMISETRRAAAAFYDEVGSPQEEFWMTTEPLQILAG
jgi:hypothetical protein